MDWQPQIPKQGSAGWQALIQLASVHVCIEDVDEWLKHNAIEEVSPTTENEKDIYQKYIRLLEYPQLEQLLSEVIDPLHRLAVDYCTNLDLSSKSDKELFGLVCLCLCCEDEIHGFVSAQIDYSTAVVLRAALFWHPHESNPIQNWFSFDCFRGVRRSAIKILGQLARRKIKQN